MNNYKLCPPAKNNVVSKAVLFFDVDGSVSSIPFSVGNSDYQIFKDEIQGIGEFGQSITPVELQDADGNTMTEEEVAEFVATLP